MAPKLNRRRAVFVLSKIDEILSWERATDRERDSKFVELGRYLCEVRAGQYWRVDNVRSFDEFLERKSPESRRKAYYLMAIHEQLPRIHNVELQQVGWAKATELAKLARRDGQRFDSATWQGLEIIFGPAHRMSKGSYFTCVKKTLPYAHIEYRLTQNTSRSPRRTRRRISSQKVLIE